MMVRWMREQPEVTESATMEDVKQAVPAFRRLRKPIGDHIEYRAGKPWNPEETGAKKEAAKTKRP